MALLWFIVVTRPPTNALSCVLEECLYLRFSPPGRCVCRVKDSLLLRCVCIQDSLLPLGKPELWPCGRVPTLQPGDRGWIPGQVRPKTVKSGTWCCPAWHSAWRVGLGEVPCDVLASCPGGVRVLSYIKSPHAKESGDRLLPLWASNGSRNPALKAPTSSSF